MQTGYWVAKRYNAATSGLEAVNLDNIKQVSPQLSTNIAGINIDFYYTLLFGGSALYTKDHHAFALKLEKDLSVVKVEYESILTKNGGLVAGGFDTLSPVINNSLDHHQSSIKLKTIGFGLGRSSADEYSHMIRVSKAINNDLTVSLNGGIAKIYTWAFTEAASTIEKDKVVGVTSKYAFSNHLNLEAAYGKFFGDNKDHAGSLTLNANF